MSRDRQLRSNGLLCFGVAGVDPLVGSMVEEVTDYKVVERSTCRYGPLSVDLQRGLKTLSVWSNVEMWPFLAYGSWIGVRTVCPVSLRLRLSRVHTW